MYEHLIKNSDNSEDARKRSLSALPYFWSHDSITDAQVQKRRHDTGSCNFRRHTDFMSQSLVVYLMELELKLMTKDNTDVSLEVPKVRHSEFYVQEMERALDENGTGFALPKSLILVGGMDQLVECIAGEKCLMQRNSDSSAEENSTERWFICNNKLSFSDAGYHWITVYYTL